MIQAQVAATARGCEDRVSVRSAVLAISAGLLGLALQLTDGLYTPTGMLVLTVSFVLCLTAILTPQTRVRSISPEAFCMLLAALVGAQLVLMLFATPGASAATVPVTSRRPVYMGLTTALAGLALIAVAPRRLSFAGGVLLLATFTALGIWKIRTAPDPVMDVFIFHRDAAEALFHGHNPYAITFPNVYGPDPYVYGPGIVRDGRLQFGYPYPPLVLMLTSASHILCGDSRYAQLASMLLTAVMIGVIRPGRMGMLIAALVLFTPRTLYIVEMSWTEPISVTLLTLLVLCAVRAPGLVPVALGLLIASKQYLPATMLLAPLLVIGKSEMQSNAQGACSLGLVSRDVRRTRSKWGKDWLLDAPRLLWIIIVSVIVAGAVTLPLALWDTSAFWWSVVKLQTLQPYRPDSLGFLAWWGHGTPGWVGPIWLSFAALIVAVALSYWRAGHGVAGFTAGFALCFFAFFIFNKQAFANYYYLALGALGCAIACNDCTAGGTCADKEIIGPCAQSSPSSSQP